MAGEAHEAEKTLDYYMSLPYEVVIKPSEGGWFAEVPNLPGCITWAESSGR